MVRARAAWLIWGLVLPTLLLAACGGGDDTDAAAAIGEPTRPFADVTPPFAGDKPPIADDASPAAGGERAGKEKRGPSALELGDRGNPLVQVRRDRRVDLYDRPGGKVIATVGDETEFGSPTAFAVQREHDGWAAVPTAHFENGRLAWLRLDPRRLRAFTVFYEVEIDLSEYRTTVLRRDKVLRSFRVSIGMPEAPTPTGQFAVTDTFRGGLNSGYGCCAVALTARQTRLPPGWLGGDRIAIHGTSGALGARVSHGCVRAADADVSDLVNRLPPGTPVTIRQ